MGKVISVQPDKLVMFSEELKKTSGMLENIFNENRETISKTNYRIDMTIDSLNVKRNAARNEHESASAALSSASIASASVVGAAAIAPLIERERRARERLNVLEQACQEARKIKDDYQGMANQYSREEQKHFQDYRDHLKRTSSFLEKYTDSIRRSSKAITENSLIGGRMPVNINDFRTLAGKYQGITAALSAQLGLAGLSKSALIASKIAGSLGLIGRTTGTGTDGNVLPAGPVRQGIIIDGWRINPDGSKTFDSPVETGRTLNFNQGKTVDGEVYKGTCGIVSCQNVLNMLGVKKTEEELIRHARDNNLAHHRGPPYRNGGTHAENRKDILKAHGIESTLEAQSVENIATAVEAEKGVIISVETKHFWSCPTGGPHAVVVTSVTKDKNGNVTGFHITDSGDKSSSRFISLELMDKSLNKNRFMNVTKNKRKDV